jgi:hypothetical protein
MISYLDKISSPVTVLAPVDDGFLGLDVSALSEAQAKILAMYHIIPRKIYSGDLPTGKVATSLTGYNVTFAPGTSTSKTQVLVDKVAKSDILLLEPGNIPSSQGNMIPISKMLYPYRWSMISLSPNNTVTVTVLPLDATNTTVTPVVTPAAGSFELNPATALVTFMGMVGGLIALIA